MLVLMGRERLANLVADAMEKAVDAPGSFWGNRARRAFGVAPAAPPATPPRPKIARPKAIGKRKATEQHRIGTRGGKWYFDDKGQKIYGTRPPHKGARVAPPPPRAEWGDVAPHPIKVEHSDQLHLAPAHVAHLRHNAELEAGKVALTPEAWRDTVMKRLGRDGQPGDEALVGVFSRRLADWAQDGGQELRAMVDGMRPEVREAAVKGLQHAEHNRHLAEHGALSERSVLLHFIWGILSANAPPFAQEASWLDLTHHHGMNQWIDRCMAGTFDRAKFSAWLAEHEDEVLPRDAATKWYDKKSGEYRYGKGYLKRPAALQARKKGYIPEPGTPGRGNTHLVRDLAGTLERWNGRTKELAAIFQDPSVDGREARRRFWEGGFGKSGVGNKILSFVSGMLGKTDVMVLDIWQTRNFMAPEYEKLAAEVGKSEASATIAEPYNSKGILGLANYEALEDQLGRAVPGLRGIPGLKPSIFAAHWLTWVAVQDAVVGHGSLGSLHRMDQRGLLTGRPQDPERPNPSADDVLLGRAQGSVREGNPKMTAYGATYTRGTVRARDLDSEVYQVPTEFVTGSYDDGAFHDWLEGQPREVIRDYTHRLSRQVEPIVRRLGAAHGLAISVDESYGGFAGRGTANSLIHVTPERDGWTPEEAERKVRAFAADLGYTFRQDAAVYGRVAPRFPAPGTDPERMVRTGYDFPLVRRLSAEEMDALATKLDAAVPDVGFTILANGKLRALNYTDQSDRHGGRYLRDEEFASRIARALRDFTVSHGKAGEAGGGDAVSVLYRGEGGRTPVERIPWEGGYLSNDWRKTPGGDDYVQARGADGSVGGRSGDRHRRSLGVAAGGDESGTLVDRLRETIEGFNGGFFGEDRRVAKGAAWPADRRDGAWRPLLLLKAYGHRPQTADPGGVARLPGVRRPVYRPDCDCGPDCDDPACDCPHCAARRVERGAA